MEQSEFPSLRALEILAGVPPPFPLKKGPADVSGRDPLAFPHDGQSSDSEEDPPGKP